MPAPISYLTKRGIIIYKPPDLPSPESEPAQLPAPPCRPRARRAHSIHITRLPTPNSLRNKCPTKRINLKEKPPHGVVKRMLASVLAPLTLESSTESYNIATSTSELSRDSGPARATLTIAAVSAEESHSDCNQRTRSRIISGTIMSVSPMCDNSWRSDISTQRNSINDSSSRNGMLGMSRLTTSQRTINDPEKPLASGNGVSCSIMMAEPVIFLMGLDHDGTTRDSHGANATALLRGSLRLNVTKNAKIKAVSLKFTGRAKTLWPEGIPPQKQETVEECSLRTQVIPFFNALHKSSETSFGDLCSYTLRDSKTVGSLAIPAIDISNSTQQGGFSLSGITNRATRYNPTPSVSDARRLSAQSIQSKNIPKGDSTSATIQSKGYKIFYPGVYDYSFELPIDNNMPETTNLPLASVKWELEATIERAGTFKANLSGKKEIPVIRSPSQDSLELVEPIAVSRTWDQQLHYDIVISGKSFPIGTKIPIAFKLTPLAKVQVHKVKVFLTENIDYFAKDKTVQRRDSKRKMLLLEKSAGKPVSREFWPSEVKIVGGERTSEEREMRRSLAMRRRELEAQRNNTDPVPLPDSVDNLLGDIDLGIEEWWGPTEIEMNVQLPTCEIMERDRGKRLAHDCTWKNVQVHHWLKILIRLSRADIENPSKRRHYEISVDSPISLLSCRASQANISLPEYSGQTPNTLGVQQVCGCTGAMHATGSANNQSSQNETSSLSQTLGPNASISDLSRLERTFHSSSLTVSAQRPMHLMRNPSFQPPPFDAEQPPPPITTPPPLYDHVIGTPSHDGLADYFARLGEYEGELTDDEDSIHSVSHNCINSTNLRTHGGHLARIIDINRDVMFNTSAANSIMTGIESGVSNLDI